MSTYEAGFTAGERAAFKDRRNNIVRTRPEVMPNEYTRAYWEGYTPRTLSWAARPVKAETAWWHERESVCE